MSRRKAITGADLLDGWLASIAGRKSEHSSRSHAAQIRSAVAAKVDADIAAAASRYRPARLAPATVNRHRSTVKAALRWAFKEGAAPENWSPRVALLPERNARHTYLTPAQIDTLLAAIPHPGARAFLIIAALTGMRRGEVERLRPEDIVGDEIRLGINTKTGEPRVIPILPQIRPALAMLPLGVTGRYAWGALAKAREAAGLPGVRVHDLRHTFASLLINSGATLYEVGRILGHTTPATTARYAHLSSATLRAAVGRLGGIPVGSWDNRQQDAGIAQLAEQRFCKPKVAGSTPAAGTIGETDPTRAREAEALVGSRGDLAGNGPLAGDLVPAATSARPGAESAPQARIRRRRSPS